MKHIILISPKQKSPACNSTYNKLAVKCSAETFLVYGSLVLRNYIRGDSRQLLVAANRYMLAITKGC